MFSRRQFFRRISAIAFLPVVGPLMECPREEEMFLFECFVAGFAYYDDKKVLKTLSPGDPLILKREPRNSHDHLAIEIYTQNGVKLGYVPRDINAVPSALMDQSVPLKAVIAEVNDPLSPSWERVRFEVRSLLRSELKGVCQ